jgi:hypothetical protein
VCAEQVTQIGSWQASARGEFPEQGVQDSFQHTAELDLVCRGGGACDYMMVFNTTVFHVILELLFLLLHAEASLSKAGISSK